MLCFNTPMDTKSGYRRAILKLAAILTLCLAACSSNKKISPQDDTTTVGPEGPRQPAAAAPAPPLPGSTATPDVDPLVASLRTAGQTPEQARLLEELASTLEEMEVLADDGNFESEPWSRLLVRKSTALAALGALYPADFQVRLAIEKALTILANDARNMEVDWTPYRQRAFDGARVLTQAFPSEPLGHEHLGVTLTSYRGDEAEALRAFKTCIDLDSLQEICRSMYNAIAKDMEALPKGMPRRL